MHYVLTGFTQEVGIRVFRFERIGNDQVRTEFTVRADLAMSRRYDIRMQELPLLCRLLLERSEGAEEQRAFTFTEDQMCVHSKKTATARQTYPFRKKPPTEVAATLPPEQGTTKELQPWRR